MKKSSLAILSGLLLASCGSSVGTGDVKPAIPADKGIEEKVKEILSKMTLEDKIGQMCEIEISLVIAGN